MESTSKQMDTIVLYATQCKTAIMDARGNDMQAKSTQSPWAAEKRSHVNAGDCSLDTCFTHPSAGYPQIGASLKGLEEDRELSLIFQQR